MQILNIQALRFSQVLSDLITTEPRIIVEYGISLLKIFRKPDTERGGKN